MKRYHWDEKREISYWNGEFSLVGRAVTDTSRIVFVLERDGHTEKKPHQLAFEKSLSGDLEVESSPKSAIEKLLGGRDIVLTCYTHVRVYRGISVNSGGQINVSNPGSWWSAYRPYAEEYGGNGVLLSGEVPMNHPDVQRHVGSVIDSYTMGSDSIDELFIEESLVENVRVERGKIDILALAKRSTKDTKRQHP